MPRQRRTAKDKPPARDHLYAIVYQDGVEEMVVSRGVKVWVGGALQLWVREKAGLTLRFISPAAYRTVTEIPTVPTRTDGPGSDPEPPEPDDTQIVT